MSDIIHDLADFGRVEIFEQKRQNGLIGIVHAANTLYLVITPKGAFRVMPEWEYNHLS